MAALPKRHNRLSNHAERRSAHRGARREGQWPGATGIARPTPIFSSFTINDFAEQTKKDGRP